MVAAKEKMLRRETLLTQTKICAEPSRQPATTKTQNQPTTKTNSPTVVNRISSYDFTARKFQKPPIGSTEKIRCIVPLAARTKPRKNTGENLPHVRRLHRAPELSLYRAYFVPNHLDPYGMMIRIQDLEHDTESFPGHEVVWTGTIQHYYKGLDCFGRPIYDPPLWVDTLEELKEWINRDTTSGLPIPPDCGDPSTFGDFLPDVYDCTDFSLCVAKTTVFGFADDVGIGGTSLLNKRVREWAASPAGKKILAKFGHHGLGFAALYAIWKCRHLLTPDGDPIDGTKPTSPPPITPTTPPPTKPTTPPATPKPGGGLGYDPRHQPWGFGPKY